MIRARALLGLSMFLTKIAALVLDVYVLLSIMAQVSGDGQLMICSYLVTLSPWCSEAIGSGSGPQYLHV